MQRTEDYKFDDGLDEALGELDRARGRLGHLRDRLFMLQAAYDEIALRGTQKELVSPEAHAYIPIDLNEFFEGLFELERILAADPDFDHPELAHRPARFVDAGCGTGRLVHLLHATDRMNFLDIHGFDLSEKMISLGRERFGLGEKIFVADCLDFDYSGYDVIFFYRPLEDEALEHQFENRIVEQMRKGAYVFCFGARGLYDDRRLQWRDSRFGIFKRL
ncbi:MAG: class I SAM-dependent methyltransferase [Pseudomonadota bacterium]